MSDEKDAFVFLDRGGKRWPRLRLVALVAGVLAFVALVLFVQTLLSMPKLEQSGSLRQLQGRLKTLQAQQAAKPEASPPIWLKPAPGSAGQGGAVPPGRGPAEEVRLGFYAGWDPASLVSLTEHAGELTHLSPKWLTVTDGEGTLTVEPDDDLRELARDAGLVLMPRLDNLQGDTWLPEAVEGVLQGPPARRGKFITEVVGHLQEAEAGGVIVDWCQLDPTYRSEVTILLQELATALHGHDLQLWLGVPVGDELRAFDLAALAPVVDRFVAMLHDENSEHDVPGPIASQPWYDGWLAAVTSYGKPAQWVISLGTYGYDWTDGGSRAELIGFADAMARAGRAQVRCAVEPPYGNPFFSYVEENRRHTVWFLDGVTFANQLLAARRLGVGGFGIFQLGTEDPAVWQALDLHPGQADLDRLSFLQTLPASGPIANLGRGDFIRVEDARQDGARDLTLGADGLLTSHYQRFPSYLTVTHQGEGNGDQVAITFDDGPDAGWTPQILDILKERQVKAAFFMLGTKMEDHPDLVRRIVAEGHEVGVHTYTHPDLAEVSAERALLELNATQVLLEGITGRSTLLFRPPYNADSRPATEAGIIPVRIAQGLGYLTVGHSIDPKDWQKPGAEELVERVKSGRAFGRVVLLHDAGGNREQTVTALPGIIDYLQARGDRIVPLGELIGQPAAVLLPPPVRQSPFDRLVSQQGLDLLHSVESFLWAFMIVATVLVGGRTLAVILLARRQRRDEAPAGPFEPPVSVVIAAYNEGKVIARTLAALLRSDYAGEMEIIVVDDGSTDRTATEVQTVGREDGRVRLLRQENLGKARALRAGLATARHGIVVTLDADTHFQPDTIRHLVAPLADPAVGAVSGHAKVGNLRSFIARCQDLEYTCGFNLDRRAYHHLNCITVVPGAVSALRSSAVRGAGGISTDTLAEDTDLTLALHRLGYRVAYAPAALAWTEAPERFGALARQRFRWAFGTLQCLWKHRDLVFSGRNRALGWFSLPGLWFFQILLVAIAPLVDGFLVAALCMGGGLRIGLFIGFFLGMDLLLAALACRLEPEPVRHAWRIVPMRFVYRPLLSWVVWKSLIRAGKGALVGWGKQERSGSVTVPAAKGHVK